MDLKGIIRILKNGERDDARAVLKLIEKIWKNNKWNKSDWAYFIKELKNFDLIESTENKISFLMALRYPFIAIGRRYFMECSDFIFKILSQDSLRLRQLGISLGKDFIHSFELAKYVIDKKWKPNDKDEARIRGDRDLFVSFVARLEEFRNENCGAKMMKYDYIEELPSSVCKSSEGLLFEILEHEGPEYIYAAYKKGDLPTLDLTSPESIYEMEELKKDRRGDLVIPEWMECTWRRIPCGRKDCMICGRIRKDQERAIAKGMSPDSMEAILINIKESLAKTLRFTKADVDKLGNELKKIKISQPPSQDKFILCREIMVWNEALFHIMDRARESEAMWVETELAADIFWYANILNTKIYRQLCNHWYIKRGDKNYILDFKYNSKVIDESLRIIKNALNELSLWSTYHKGELMLAAARLIKLEEKITKI